MLLAAMLVFSATSCTKEDIEPEDESKITVVDEKPTLGGTMIIGTIEPKELNPLTSDSKSFADISCLLFERLLEYDEKLKIKPVLAQSWDFIEGTSEYRIKLRDDIYWSDNQPITAKDVIYSLDTIKASAASIYKSNLEHIYSYKAIDTKNISIIFDQPFTYAVDMLTIPIIPEHSFGKGTGIVPVSSGAYKISQYSRLKHMELEQNDKWVKLSKNSNGEAISNPYIQNLKVMFVNDVEAFSTAFQTKELDILNTLSYDWEKYRELKDVSAYEYISMYYDFIGLNHNNPIFADKNVRKAMLHAINRRVLVDKYLLGNAVIVDAPINPSSWLYDKAGRSIMHSKTDAERLLKEAGFSDTNGDKILERNVDGATQTLKFTLTTNSENEFRKKAAEDIKKYLEEIGFSVNIRYFTYADTKLALESKQFDAVLTGYNLAFTQDLSFAFHSTQIALGKNYYSYSNTDFDDLLYQAHTVTDDNRRKEIYQKIQDGFVEEVPCISLFFREGAIVVRNKVKGDIQPDSFNQFRNINKWFISKQGK